MLNKDGNLIPGKPIALIGKKKINILHTPASIVTLDNEIYKLAGRMLTTCRINGGMAIAANQVGIPINLVVTNVGKGYINIGYAPDKDRETEEATEGCLSLPGKRFVVLRFKKIELNTTNLKGEYVFEKMENLQARMWQHETDHIQGKLLSDNPNKEVRLV